MAAYAVQKSIRLNFAVTDAQVTHVMDSNNITGARFWTLNSGKDKIWTVVSVFSLEEMTEKPKTGSLSSFVSVHLRWALAWISQRCLWMLLIHVFFSLFIVESLASTVNVFADDGFLKCSWVWGRLPSLSVTFFYSTLILQVNSTLNEALSRMWPLFRVSRLSRLK